MAYNFFNLGIIGTEIKRRLEMLKDITGTNSVVSTNELESEVNTLNQSITNTNNELNASINATKLQFNSSIKKAINLKDDGTSYVDAGNVLDINDVPDVPDTPDDDIDLDNYDIILEVEQVKSDVDNINNNISDINKQINNINDNVSNINGDISIINTNINNINKNIVDIDNSINEDINKINSDIDDLKSNISNINSGINEDINKINSDIDDLNDHIININNNILMTQQNITNIENYVNDYVNGVADYIIERETSGNWTYEKYMSGKAVCWGTITEPIGVNTAYSGHYIYSGITHALPPNLFKTIESIHASCLGYRYCDISLNDVTTTKVSFHYKFLSQYENFKQTTYAHLIGRWK